MIVSILHKSSGNKGGNDNSDRGNGVSGSSGCNIQNMKSRTSKIEDKSIRITELFDISRRLSRSNTTQALTAASDALALAQELARDDLTAEAHALLGFCYRELSNFPASRKHYLQSIELYRGLKAEAEIGRCLYGLGTVYRQMREFELAIESFSTSLNIHYTHGDRIGESRTLNSLGLVYIELGDYLKAIDYLHKSLNLRKSFGSSDLDLGTTLNNLGLVYAELNDFREALKYFEGSLAQYVQQDNSRAYAVCLGNIGEVHLSRGDDEEAKRYLEDSLHARRKLDDLTGQAEMLISIGKLHKKHHEFDTARDNFIEAFDISEKVGDRLRAGQASFQLGTVCFAEQNFDEALEHLLLALDTAKDINDKNLVYQVHEALSSVYESLGDLPEALKHSRAYAESRKDVLADVNERTVAAMQARFNVEQTEKQKEIIRLRNVELTNAIHKVESLNKHLVELNDEKDMLLSILSHDLRNSLQVVDSSVTVLQRYGARLEDDEKEHNYKSILGAVKRIDTIIGNLLKLNRIESGHWEMQPQPLDLFQITSRAVHDHVEMAHRKMITIELQSHESIGYVRADNTAMRSILDNLISNAIKFSPKDSTITVNVYRRNAFVGFSISDQGQGFSTSDKEKLFTKFARLSSRPTAGEITTGLGLSIVKKLVDLHRGTIRLNSSKGHGATFYVEFPVLASPDLTSSSDDDGGKSDSQ